MFHPSRPAASWSGCSWSHRPAAIRTRTRCIGVERRDIWRLVLEVRGRRDIATARVLVNATGPWLKLFAADVSGVRLVRSRDEVDLPPSASACSLGQLYAYIAAELSADGNIIATTMQRTVDGSCSYPPLVWGSSLITPAGERALAVALVARFT